MILLNEDGFPYTLIRFVRKIPCEIYSRVVGYFRPVSNWNIGKQAEFRDRVPYDTTVSLNHPRPKEAPHADDDRVA